MRKIEFRVWHKKWGVWLNDKDIYLMLDGGLAREDRPGMLWVDDDDYVVQQFTGLFDKKDKEIYEGDIMLWLNNPYMSNEEVDKWVEAGQPPIEQRRDIDVVSWQKYRWAPFYDHLGGGIPEKGEIIGNILENPELLKR